MNGIYERIDEERESRGMTWGQLSRGTNISRSTFTKWKQGPQAPDFNSIVKIADFWGCTLDQLIGRLPRPKTPNSRVLTPREEQLLDEYKRNKTFKRVVNAMLDEPKTTPPPRPRADTKRAEH